MSYTFLSAVIHVTFFFIFPKTKTLKLEKEAQKSKARKSRDAFLLMLAENTVIDARTNWRSAILVLQDDSRFKNVEDAHDREDLFNDFVSELEKKEKEDRNKHRDAALKHLGVLYDDLLAKGLHCHSILLLVLFAG